ncbi:uncharacterized protein SCHCODRAFT_02501785 [Schizophyllum commune H4-8]|uniref:Uncharacterized protein n=1 Tax=Schizophyllum commune (strain H4-8 / FGSC 9210) TaxID=578458 RepID=D8Q3S6_SCHCM|nr:uncharacterized protein SCHCODRAFT_02501785 [Schizophyllum commune H4-8]KAI5892911.1 hypothetical protein SCHCODRAFT_02501785 [Schizophyllum commune H4-8]
MATTKQAFASPTPRAPGFTPNFFSEYSVVIDRPRDEVFNIIGTAAGAERVTRLSDMCTRFEMLKQDEVSLASGEALKDSAMRTQAAVGKGEGIANASDESASQADPARHLPRQHFSMTETIPLLFGIIKHDVLIVGTLTWDTSACVALYESEADQGVLVWKLRTFEEVEGGSTRVNERIEGKCSALLRPIVQRETTRGHQAHMNAYQMLFKAS